MIEYNSLNFRIATPILYQRNPSAKQPVYIIQHSTAQHSSATKLVLYNSAKTFVWYRLNSASVAALGHLPPGLPTILFLVHFRVNLTANYPSILYFVRSADADVDNSQLFQSVLH